MVAEEETPLRGGWTRLRRLEQRCAVRSRIVLVGDPLLDLGERDLGVELHAPHALAEPERLRASRAVRELLSSGRHAVGVVVPLERFEARR